MYAFGTTVMTGRCIVERDVFRKPALHRYEGTAGSAPLLPPPIFGMCEIQTSLWMRRNILQTVAATGIASLYQLKWQTGYCCNSPFNSHILIKLSWHQTGTQKTLQLLHRSPNVNSSTSDSSKSWLAVTWEWSFKCALKYFWISCTWRQTTLLYNQVSFDFHNT